MSIKTQGKATYVRTRGGFKPVLREPKGLVFLEDGSARRVLAKSSKRRRRVEAREARKRGVG